MHQYFLLKKEVIGAIVYLASKLILAEKLTFPNAFGPYNATVASL